MPRPRWRACKHGARPLSFEPERKDLLHGETREAANGLMPVRAMQGRGRAGQPSVGEELHGVDPKRVGDVPPGTRRRTGALVRESHRHDVKPVGKLSRPVECAIRLEKRGGRPRFTRARDSFRELIPARGDDHSPYSETVGSGMTDLQEAHRVLFHETRRLSRGVALELARPRDQSSPDPLPRARAPLFPTIIWPQVRVSATGRCGPRHPDPTSSAGAPPTRNCSL